MPAFACFAAAYLGARDTNGAAVGDVAWLQPSTSTIASATTATSFGAAQDWASAGTKATQKFRAGIAFGDTNLFRARVRAQWQIVATATAGAPTGRLEYVWLKNNVAITGASTVVGTTQALNAVNGTQYTDIVTVSLPSGTTFAPGDTLELQVSFVVVVAAATATGQVQLNHDPAVAAQRLIVEFETNA